MRRSSSTAFCWASASRSSRAAVCADGAVVFVAQGPADLLDQLVVQAVDEVADVVLDVADVQVLPPPDSRDRGCRGRSVDDIDDRFRLGNGLWPRWLVRPHSA